MAGTNTTSTLSNNVVTAYNKLFGFKYVPKLAFKPFVTSKEHANGVDAQPGTPVQFTRYNNLNSDTTPIDEVTASNQGQISNSTISVDIEEYGKYLAHSEKIRTINTDTSFLNSTTELLSRAAAETTDLLVREALDANTLPNQLRFVDPSNNSADTTLLKTDVMTADDFSIAKNNLERNSVPMPVGLSNYISIVHPDVATDITNGASAGEFQDVMRYARPEAILNGEIGQFRGFRVIKSNLAKVSYTGAALQTATTVSGAHSKGDTVISLTSGTGIDAGDLLSIDVSSVRYTYEVISRSTNDVTIGKLVNQDGELKRGVEDNTNTVGLATALAGGEAAGEYTAVYTSYFFGAEAIAHAYAINPELRFNMDGSDPYGRKMFAAWYSMEGYAPYAEESSFRIRSSSSLSA